MKKTHRSVKRLTALLTALALVFSAASAASAAAGKENGTKNHSDDIVRLFRDKPAYCLYCGEIHTGVGGAFKQLYHDVAYFFCGLVGRFPEEGRMRFTIETIDAGADKSFYFLHVGDTHLSLIDERDYGDERLVEAAQQRSDYCPQALRMLDDAALKAQELCLFTVHTGDIVDFVTQKNLDAVKAFTTENDVFACAGDRDYADGVLDEPEDSGRERNEDRVNAVFSNDVRFSTRTEHGVKFIAVDNADYRIEQWQLDRFKEELAEGLPVILVTHVPFYAPDLFEFQTEKQDRPHPAGLMAVPEELMRAYGYEEAWIEEQKANDAANEFYNVVISSPNVKAIVAGHVHADFVSQVSPALKQYTVDCTQGQIIVVT